MILKCQYLRKEVICMRRITEFMKKEIVLVVSTILAVISCFVVTPDKEYIEYMDFRTLAILFCLMAIVAGFMQLGVFELLAGTLLKVTKKMYQVVLVLVLLCFFLGMLITNDVALITFVPFSFTVLTMVGKEEKERWIVAVVCMQTLAANMGSMLTPLGNPQNLYLYGKGDMNFGKFVMTILPYSAAAFAFIVVWILLRCRRLEKGRTISFSWIVNKNSEKSKTKLIVYVILSVVCMSTVLRFLDYRISLAIVLAAIILFDRKTLEKVDYSLLLTFTALFIFIGNASRIEAFSNIIEKLITGNEIETSIVVSQFTSNVPAALLLSEFTKNYDKLIVGVNIGGLGTLIASMASLISYKIFANEEPDKKGKYFVWFTVSGIVLLSILYPMTRIL